MTLQSSLFKNDSALEACLIRDSAHLTIGVAGEHVSKVQQAILALDDAGINNRELAAILYGRSTADAVLNYKQHRNIINTNYQTAPDGIVGKMTISRLDAEITARPANDPLTNPRESERIQRLLERERLGVLLMIQRTLQSLADTEAAFNLADVDPQAAAGSLFVNRFAVSGLDRFFAVTQKNHRTALPPVIANFRKYLSTLNRLSIDQRPADYPFLLHHAPMPIGNPPKPLLASGKITGDTPPAFSSQRSPRGIFFTPRYREFDPAMPLVFRGLFREALDGIQIHEMGHFYFGFEDIDPRGKPPQICLRAAASYDLLARMITFRH
jgi:hypothetical protein